MITSKGSDPRDETRSALGRELRESMRALVAARKADAGVASAKQRVRRWQNRRFAATYADLSGEPRYSAAIAFFLNELYGDVDMSGRDADLMRVLPAMTKLLPPPALETVRDALAFETLSERLDTELARHLGSARLTVASYGESFRACGRPDLRRKQLQHVEQIGAALDRLTRLPMVGTSLRLMRAPAQRAGFAALQSFLERGFTAFKEMRGARTFLATIIERESAIVDRLFAGDPRPFELADEA